MICPKCGKTMTLGKSNLFSGGYYFTKGALPFWAEKEYFVRETFPNAKDAEKKGIGFGIRPPAEKIDIAFSNLPDVYACKDCKVILLECGRDE